MVNSVPPSEWGEKDLRHQQHFSEKENARLDFNKQTGMEFNKSLNTAMKYAAVEVVNAMHNLQKQKFKQKKTEKKEYLGYEESEDEPDYLIIDRLKESLIRLEHLGVKLKSLPEELQKEDLEI